jgi:hypothetical protein
MSNFYDSFANKYRVKNVQVSRDRAYRTIDYSYYNKTASYYADHDEIIEMELTRSGFENLVKLDNEHEKLWQDQRDEAWLRKTYPQLKDAYDKYQMLLALYK